MLFPIYAYIEKIKRIPWVQMKIFTDKNKKVAIHQVLSQKIFPLWGLKQEWRSSLGEAKLCYFIPSVYSLCNMVSGRRDEWLPCWVIPNAEWTYVEQSENRRTRAAGWGATAPSSPSRPRRRSRTSASLPGRASSRLDACFTKTLRHCKFSKFCYFSHFAYRPLPQQLAALRESHIGQEILVSLVPLDLEYMKKSTIFKCKCLCA